MPTQSKQLPCRFRSSSGVAFGEGYWKHDRYYGAWKDSYQFPIDEELNRLDMLNKFFLLARCDQAFSCPVRRGSSTRVLDLGTGTGIWAIQVSHVMAVDLNMIQPALLVDIPHSCMLCMLIESSIPPNLTILQFDIEDTDWTTLLKNCDLVHMRLLLGSIHNDAWPATYQKTFDRISNRHTAPGGFIEQVEIDWVPRWESANIPESSALLEWSQKFLEGMDHFQRSARVLSRKVQRMLEAAGYVGFEETIIRCCVSPWSNDTRERLVAKWFNLCLTEGIEAMSLAPLVEKCCMTICEIKKLQARVKRESCNLQLHAYFNM
ncbi:methyl transferase [Cordyceps javanica]|uniref:Methyl transferase n=1 Tax=Cordyceps javanica TaxID=43265 RepID=A0A545ULA4_9HYPO|nr:methyl transferase [Cordyceps javanica]TQW01676.1 methyl transferase [Cordyceps javanica]